MLVERSMLTMRIERSICPLTMLVESSMLTMRIEGASVRLQDGYSQLFWFAEDSGLFWSDGLTSSITECIYMDQ